MKLNFTPALCGTALMMLLNACGLQGSREPTVQSAATTAIQPFKQSDASTSLGKTRLIFATGSVAESDSRLVRVGSLQLQVTRVIPNLTDSKIVSSTETAMLDGSFPVYFSTELHDSTPSFIAIVSNAAKRKLLHPVLERSDQKITLQGISIYELYISTDSKVPTQYFCNLSTGDCKHYSLRWIHIPFEELRPAIERGTLRGFKNHALYYPTRTVTRSTTLTASIVTIDPAKREITIPASALGDERKIVIRDSTMQFPVTL